jgi:hypothetical protein
MSAMLASIMAGGYCSCPWDISRSGMCDFCTVFLHAGNMALVLFFHLPACVEDGRATHQKEPGPLSPQSAIPTHTMSLWVSVMCETIKSHDYSEFSLIDN